MYMYIQLQSGNWTCYGNHKMDNDCKQVSITSVWRGVLLGSNSTYTGSPYNQDSLNEDKFCSPWYLTDKNTIFCPMTVHIQDVSLYMYL